LTWDPIFTSLSYAKILIKNLIHNSERNLIMKDPTTDYSKMEKEIKKLQKENSFLRSKLYNLEKRLERLERKVNSRV